VKDGNRDTLQDFLKKQGIQANIYFPVPQNELPVYTNKQVQKVAHQVAESVLSLPMWPHLSTEVQNIVTETIMDFYR
jgi:dTDP-4-amino-4,6-dideoxygalactose transaminase